MTRPPASHPKVSVIVPCFNQGQFIDEAVDSVLRQTCDDFEIIVVDDGSSDPDTAERLASYRRPKTTVIRTRNQGLAEARNTGIRHGTGAYILPVDADNRIRPAYLERAVEVLDRSPEIGIVYANGVFFGDRTGPWKPPDFDLHRLLYGNFIDACAVFRRSVWSECGGYDPGIPRQLGYEDWDLWLSAAEKGWRFHRIDETLFEYRVRADSMVSRCNLPENRRLLVEYLCAKHLALFSQGAPWLIAEKDTALLSMSLEAERLAATLRSAQSELAQARGDADRLRARVAAMERSRFWKLRHLWRRARAIIGRGEE